MFLWVLFFKSLYIIINIQNVLWESRRNTFQLFISKDQYSSNHIYRLLHYPPLYKRIHKQHHEWTAPIGLITVYCHPIENVLSNSIPAAIGPFVMRSHVLTTAIWLISIQTVSMVHHSGYHLPFLPSPEFHDFHHLKWVIDRSWTFDSRRFLTIQRFARPSISF